jgi:hypothetical protein
MEGEPRRQALFLRCPRAHSGVIIPASTSPFDRYRLVFRSVQGGSGPRVRRPNIRTREWAPTNRGVCFGGPASIRVCGYIMPALRQGEEGRRPATGSFARQRLQLPLGARVGLLVQLVPRSAVNDQQVNECDYAQYSAHRPHVLCLKLPAPVRANDCDTTAVLEL